MYAAARRRVVVTGLGLCTPLGVGVEFVWRRLLLGECGIRSLPDKPSFKDLPCQVAGMVPVGMGPGEFNLAGYVSKPDLRMMSRDSVYSLGIALEALKDARWMPEDRSTEDDEVTGVSIGNGGISPVSDYLDAGELIMNGKYRKISPYFIPKVLPNMPAGHISIRYRLKGPNHCVSTACAAGLHSIGDSAHMIARGACDVMVTGAADFGVNPIILAGFCRAKALSTKFNDEPLKSSRPFDSKRDGFVLSEGVGILVLEELEHAKRRRANIYAEILGYGMSSDANHITAPTEDGTGAARAMRAALRDAGIQIDRVGHVNAHATSTPLGDLAETRAIKQTFGASAGNLLVYAPKGALGHLMGAAGAVEAIIGILSVKSGMVPPNLNLEEKAGDFDLNYVTGGPVEWCRRNGEPRIAVCNSFGFGGTNASICIGEYLES